ncbi:MAG TPA: PfkB family carbohydrate kinase [Gaiellaceae bacterium]
MGHVEWIESVLVDRVPGPGEIAHADADWSEPGGGGGVAAVQLARLNGRCDFFTALGDDDLGRRSVERLTELGVEMHVEWFGSTRRGFVQVDAHGERTITTVGPKLRPRVVPTLEGYDAVFFVAGEPEALRAARAARFLSATPREAAFLGGVHVDLLVGSGNDPAERYEGGLDAGLVVATDGARGGAADGRRYEAAEPPGTVADTYGAGDSFAAALTFALARGDSLEAALALAARAGAAVVTGKGPFARQITQKGFTRGA